MIVMIRVLFIFAAGWIMVGCGVGRAVSLVYLAAENNSPPPNGLFKHDEISTAIVEQIPTYAATYEISAPADDIIAFYRDRLKRNGWAGGDTPIEMTYGLCYIFKRADATFEVQIVVEKVEEASVEKRAREVTILISHETWLDYNFFRLVHGLFLMPFDYTFSRLLDSVF